MFTFQKIFTIQKLFAFLYTHKYLATDSVYIPKKNYDPETT